MMTSKMMAKTLIMEEEKVSEKLSELNLFFKLARSDEYVTNLGIDGAESFIWW